MLIDWFTVAAQAINFFLLVWLLKRYLYKPILHAIDAREQRIKAQLADGAAQQEKAESEREKFHSKNEKFEQERAKLMHKAIAEADNEHQRLVEKARQDAQAERLKYEQNLALDAHKLKHTLSSKAAQEVLAITRKTLKDLASANLEEQVVAVFIKTLNELTAPVKAGITQALKATSGTEPALVRSAFDVPQKLRIKIQEAIKTMFHADMDLQFETKQDLICGIELIASGQKLAWSIDDYLLTLEKNIDTLLEADKQSPRESDEARKI
ncbi:H+-transporting two-sector ATPase subunit B/B' [Brumicola nitratireducens]|uniref:ATP synthase subunit b n=1 Tax=Glaciecola nitratireducens (strain JCM 12485 / KCTC 12276 / FR1064) TaxID=1085623 RepID=G4QN36_GLANF|nr:H+-transporting two-sector ATPase subunit B/B' [Glaciecola nitratireducens]AEP31455.1 H+-transporting two-sector ATPase, B/B' subunit [Glaciecola nitratireducens FR1064]